MRTGGRLQAAIEILDIMEQRRRPAADALKEWAASHRFAGSGDRAAIGNLVFDSLRRRRSLGWLAGDDTSRGIVLAAYAFGWGAGVAGLETALADDPHAPAALSEAERGHYAQASLEGAPAAVRADCPDWLWPSFERLFGDDAVAEVAALSQRAPVDLRANTLKSDREKVLKNLSHLKAEPIDLAPDGVRIPAGEGFARQPNIEAEAEWRKGWFEVQDAGSQLAALLSGVTPGMQVCDLCAGAGGKTLALAALMNNTGQIHAYDSDRHRLANIHDRLQRAGARNVQVRDPARQADLTDLNGRMDLVLVDAPCTGAGTWRRRPDAKWRLSPEALEKRREEQRTVLDAAAPLVAAGGRVVYITCSLLPEENDEQVEALLARAPGFRVADASANALAALGEEQAKALLARAILTRNGLSLTPARTGTDGFYIAVLVRDTA
ncbi:MAG: RsmB/NOP family class I SAM-dependent RNA methyltransferase [Rhodobiaceae bacterium]|nr:RsmB/NOP family class I SAM-dependent RNA methyltransferase [Rhodobiaceae bacterium]